jgi:hypothetical protein
VAISSDSSTPSILTGQHFRFTGINSQRVRRDNPRYQRRTQRG